MKRKLARLFRLRRDPDPNRVEHRLAGGGYLMRLPRKRYAVVAVLALAAFGLSGCFSQAAKQAPLTATLDCTVLVGQGTGSHLLTDKANAIANGWDADSNSDVYCDVAQP